MTDEMDAPRNFKGAHVVITGGGSGVGFAAAAAFIEAGANVTIIGRNLSKLETAASRLNRLEREGSATQKKETAMPAHYVVGDVGAAAFAGEVVAGIGKTGRGLDILVNAAGVILRRQAVDTTDAEWRTVMQTNVDGVFYLSRAVARAMSAGTESEGAIVNVSSTCGLVGCAGLAAYNTSKGAVIQLTRSMALELAPRNITVNAVAPGAIESDMLFSEHPDGITDNAVRAQNLASIPIGRIATPREVARSILFLAREKHITGSVLSIDGGYTAQ